VGAAYAVLQPSEGTDDAVELLDAAIDHIGHQALDPRYDPCVQANPDEVTQLGTSAFVRYQDPDTAVSWFRPAAEAGHTVAMFNLGVL